MRSRLSIKKRLCIVLAAATCLSLVPLPVQSVKEAGPTVYADGPGSLKPGKVTLRQKAVFYENAPSRSRSLRNHNAAYYGLPGQTFRVNDVKGEMAFIESDELGNLWLPAWYLSKEAGQVRNIDPLSLKLPDSSIYVAPGSSVRWPASQAGSMPLIAVSKWQDWYGVLISPDPWKKERTIYRPAVMWVKAKDVKSKEKLPAGLLEPSSELPIEAVRNLTDYLVDEGDSKSYVKQLLGEPQVKEHSRNQEQRSGRPPVIGETWRYEAREALFTATFSPAGKLTTWEWTFPNAAAFEGNYYAGSHDPFSYRFSAMPLLRTIEAGPVWRNQGNLNFTFLLEASRNVLLIKGDDGGFSGMHDNSSLYAIDRSTGKKLWQQDAGFGWYTAVPDRKREHVTMYSAYNPEKKAYESRVRHIRLTDGRILWERKHKAEFGLTMTAASGAILLLEGLDLNAKKSMLSVVDQQNGKLRWKKALSGEYRLLNQGPEDPYVLIEQSGKLTAYEPMTGKIAWTYKSGKKVMDDPAWDPYFTGGYRYEPLSPPGTTSRWMLLGDKWTLLNMKSGKREGSYPANEMERIEVLDERYLLVQRALGGNYFTGARSYETVLYDAVNQRELWTVKGRAARSVIEGDIIYLTLNGIPAAVKKETGETIWKMETSLKNSEDVTQLVGSSFGILDRYLLISFGGDLIVLDKGNGRILSRLSDIATGNVDLREQAARSGALNIADGEVYIGTVNGAFVRYDAEELKERLDERGAEMDAAGGQLDHTR
ncbi:outer membrane protein assembly factor BamB family protein [Paenibacillus lactis]|uniref:Outer membrane protein assembly factor BamB n=1 Tax=Paenibacillus lactis TaxID=228574 RepID=A0ABS4FHH4_9BACL|nr:PQQ-binding-like beta-propeller repeat protein [Paenibacillus lactis]MBP1895670.1 outer membrane protein assembly factor BamB [Paenibacillus lactis]HAG00001.1 hypothetical protein [Paenibacillus lactis]